MDILDFDPAKTDWIPDMIWASPDCTTYSLAWISHHRKNWIATSEKAKLWDKLLQKTIDIIKYYISKNPNLIYFVENPKAMMRKQKNLIDMLKETDWQIKEVTYCQYGLNYMKPTDIFTNSNTFIPKKCKNGDTCHEPAPRWSKTWLQWVKWSKLRSVIPQQLCEEIIKSLNN